LNGIIDIRKIVLLISIFDSMTNNPFWKRSCLGQINNDFVPLQEKMNLFWGKI